MAGMQSQARQIAEAVAKAGQALGSPREASPRAKSSEIKGLGKSIADWKTDTERDLDNLARKVDSLGIAFQEETERKRQKQQEGGLLKLCASSERASADKIKSRSPPDSP